MKVVLELQTPGWPGANTEREKDMKFRIEVERSALAIMVVEADSRKQAETRALQDVREEDFGHGNLYLVDVEEVTE